MTACRFRVRARWGLLTVLGGAAIVYWIADIVSGLS